MPTDRSELQRSAYEMPSAEVERMLRTGEQPELLKSYFGEERYRELRDLGRQASIRTTRGGPRVLILPGILGSTLGIPGTIFNDVIWFDPISLRQGEAIKLALGPGQRCEAFDVVPFIYTALKWRLWWYGYDADYFFYDWRQSLATLGQQLKSRLASESADEVFLVGHSMGGLVARAALAQGARKVKRLVMLGTPNHGSFSPVQVFLGTNETVRNVVWLGQHDTPELIRRVFFTFPSLYELLPTAERFSGLDLYDSATWPSTGPQPPQAMLTAAQTVQDSLAQPDENWALIAGVNQRTVVGMSRLNDGSFVEQHSPTAGDNTVPVAMARMDGLRTFYADQTHVGLPGDSRVAEAVHDLLQRNETAALPNQWPVVREATPITVRAGSAPPPFGGRQGNAVTEAEWRTVMEDFFTTVPRTVAPARAVGVATAAVPASGARTRVLTGRAPVRQIEVVLVHGSITDVECQVYAIGMFRNVTPTGAARGLDELTGGAINALIARRMFSAAAGEVFALPTVRHPVRADMLLFAGLGDFDQCTPEVQQLAARNLVTTLSLLRQDEFAAVLFGSGSVNDAAGTVRNLMTGFLDGLREIDRRRAVRRVVLVEIDATRYAEMRQFLFEAITDDLLGDLEVTLVEERAATAATVTEATRLPSQTEAPIYLVVRRESGPDGDDGYRTSVLTAGGNATVLSGFQPADDNDLAALLKKLGNRRTRDLDRIGPELARLVLSPDVLEVLARPDWRHSRLVVVNDAPSSRLPWEVLKIGDRFPASEGGLSRRYLADNLSVAKWLQQRRIGRTLEVLLVVNPTEDLDGAEREGRVIRGLMAELPAVRVTERRGAAATRRQLLTDFQSGKFDAIHYAGHAFFDAENPGRSGVQCAGQEVLSGEDLAGLGNLPALVCFNACESARVRNAPQVTERLRESVGLAEAFLRGGVANFVGTYWPVGDDEAETFAKTFYSGVLAGRAIGAALLDGRKAVRALRSADWADYLHYGDPSFRLKEPDAGPGPTG